MGENQELCEVAAAIYDGMYLLNNLNRLRQPRGFESRDNSFEAALIRQACVTMRNQKISEEMGTSEAYRHVVPTLTKYYHSVPHAKMVLDQLATELPGIEVPS